MQTIFTSIKLALSFCPSQSHLTDRSVSFLQLPQDQGQLALGEVGALWQSTIWHDVAM